MGGVQVSLHPAGHIRGSAQVRVEHEGRCLGGDRRLQARSRSHLHPVRGGALPHADHRGDLRPSGLPVGGDQRGHRRRGALGRARAAQLSAPPCSSPTRSGRRSACWRRSARAPTSRSWCTGASSRSTRSIASGGVWLPPTERVSEQPRGERIEGALVLAPPSANIPGWMRHFHEPETAFASGWMQLRGTRRRRSLDRGFAISDHVDWPALLQTIEESGAERVLATHGDSAALVQAPHRARARCRGARDRVHRRGRRMSASGLASFVALYVALDETTATSEKLHGAAAVLRLRPNRSTRSGRSTSSPGGAGGGRFPRACSAPGRPNSPALPEWLIEASYHAVGDLGETLALLCARGEGGHSTSHSLAHFAEHEIEALRHEPEEAQRARIEGWWRAFDVTACLVVHKLLRWGLSRRRLGDAGGARAGRGDRAGAGAGVASIDGEVGAGRRHSPSACSPSRTTPRIARVRTRSISRRRSKTRSTR